MSVKVYELLAAGHIELRFEVAPGETRQALISLVRSHARLGTVPESFEREELSLLHSFMGDGLAILHNLSAAVQEPFLALAGSPQGVKLDAEHLKMVAVLISPLKESGSHFQLLAKLTSLLRNQHFREELLTKENTGDILRAIKLQEESGHENYWVLSREEVLAELQSGLGSDGGHQPHDLCRGSGEGGRDGELLLQPSAQQRPGPRRPERCR